MRKKIFALLIIFILLLATFNICSAGNYQVETYSTFPGGGTNKG